MNSEFVHLHNHSDYSLLDGAQTVQTLVNTIDDLGMDSVALTEHGNMFSVIPYYKSAKKAGLMAYIKKPEYGPATIEARNVEMESVFPLAVAQKRSHIRINGSEIKETDLNIKNLYATQKK